MKKKAVFENSYYYNTKALFITYAVVICPVYSMTAITKKKHQSINPSKKLIEEVSSF